MGHGNWSSVRHVLALPLALALPGCVCPTVRKRKLVGGRRVRAHGEASDGGVCVLTGIVCPISSRRSSLNAKPLSQRTPARSVSVSSSASESESLRCGAIQRAPIRCEVISRWGYECNARRQRRGEICAGGRAADCV
jgi:hypothetical protein